MTVWGGVSCRLGSVLGRFGLLPSWGRRLDGILVASWGAVEAYGKSLGYFLPPSPCGKDGVVWTVVAKNVSPAPDDLRTPLSSNGLLSPPFPFVVWIASIFEYGLKPIIAVQLE